MKKILPMLLVFIASNIFAQDIDDSFLDDSGAAKIDSSSERYINSKLNGYELIAFSTSGCDDSYGNQKVPIKMINKLYNDDELTVEFEFSDACCISFLGDIEFEDGCLNLLYSSYGEPCECRCYYTLEYKIKTKTKIKTIKFNGESYD